MQINIWQLFQTDSLSLPSNFVHIWVKSSFRELYFKFSYLSTWNANQDEFHDKILAVLFALEELRLDCPLLALLPALVLLALPLPEPETVLVPLPEPALRILMKELLHWDSPFLPHRGQPCKYIRNLQWADILYMSCFAIDRLLIKSSQLST